MKTLEERFWPKVDVGASGQSCWWWTAAKSGFQNRYGVIGAGGRGNGFLYAHRVVWELLIGPIPEGLTIDHLCLNTLCVNPDHLQVVPQGVNTLRGRSASGLNSRKTHCKRGHAYDTANTHNTPDGRRNCRACDRERYHERKAKA